MKSPVFLLKDEAATVAFAKVMCQFLEFGDVTLLKGTLGVGKTRFVQACAAHLGYEEPTTSPTFSIANFYDLPEGHIIHIDLYRLEEFYEFSNLGVEDYFGQAITFMEWGDKFQEEFDEFLMIELDLVEGSPDARQVQLLSDGKYWDKKLTAITSVLAKQFSEL